MGRASHSMARMMLCDMGHAMSHIGTRSANNILLHNIMSLFASLQRKHSCPQGKGICRCQMAACTHPSNADGNVRTENAAFVQSHHLQIL